MTVAVVSMWILAMIVLRSRTPDVLALRDWVSAYLIFPLVDRDAIRHLYRA